MKKYLLGILIPIITLAQTPSYPDTVITNHNKVYPCRITKINSHRFNLIYGANQKTNFSILIAKKIIIENFGSIYNQEGGYSTDLARIQDFIKKRNKTYVELQRFDSLSTIPGSVETDENGFIFEDNLERNNSFGFFYSPFVQGKRVIHFNDYFSNIGYVIIEENSTVVESQFATAIKDRLHLSLNLVYSSYTTKKRSEYHRVDFDPVGQSDSGFEELNSLKIFTIEAGLKYYFSDFTPKQTSVFVSAGIGKKLAFVKNRDKDLFKDNPGNETQITDNLEDFLEELNSPFLLQLGFGAEYFFNKSLSLHSSIRFYYSSINAKYKQTEVNEYSETNRTTKYTSDEITTHIGFGLNFYF